MTDFIYKENNVLSQKTIQTYEKAYNSLTAKSKKEKGKWITSSTQNQLLNVLKEYKNPNTKKTYLSAILNIRKFNNQPIDELLHEDEILRNEVSEHRGEKRKQNLDALPSYEEIENGLNQMIDPVKFIVNFLLLKYCLRNQDMMLNIIPFGQDYSMPKTNFMIVGKSKVKMIIKKYKTERTYHSKEFEITDKRFVQKANKLLEENRPGLLLNVDGEPIDDSNLLYHIRKYTYNRLKESEICKIAITHAIQSNENVTLKLENISQTRGTSLGTLISHYNLT